MTKWVIIGIALFIFVAILFQGVDALKCTPPCI
jgi:hypothetical protein